MNFNYFELRNFCYPLDIVRESIYLFYYSVQFSKEEVRTLTDASGCSVEIIEYDGYFLSKRAIELGKIADLRSNIPNIIKMPIRPDDVFLLAYPKAGI